MQEELNKISSMKNYVFEKVKSMKEQEREEGEEIIDMGMGNKDMKKKKNIVEKI